MFFSRRFRDGREPAETVIVERATFNDPSLPAELTPNDLGIDAGFDVRYIEESGEQTQLRYDGQKPVSEKEWSARSRGWISS